MTWPWHFAAIDHLAQGEEALTQLPEYQQIVRDTLEELEPIVRKYDGPDSPLGEREAARLRENFQKAKQHCQERLAAEHPKIMLFGVYNSGKSTLLNALMGEEKAKVGDVPETFATTPYEWNGYELLDTPGIDAPAEHEKVSRQTLEECQVVLFVVSTAGSFESMAIFEAMRDVVRKGKRLLIVLNDKNGSAQQDPVNDAIRKAIQSNLINVGFSPDQAANFRLCVVNAQMALEGRLEDEPRLVELSGIQALERAIVEEIKRVNGFHIVADLCSYLLKDIDSMIGQIRQLEVHESTERLDDFLNLRVSYGEFCTEVENRIAAACASMPNEIMACFPSLDAPSGSGRTDEGMIRAGIEACIAKYGERVNEVLQKNAREYKDRLALQLHRMLDMETAASASIDETITASADTRFQDLLSGKPEYREPEPQHVGGDDIFARLEDAGGILGGTFGGMKLPIPIPKLPMFPVPVTLIFTLLPKVLRVLFGKSRSEMEAERVRAEAEARNRAQEEYARNVALWRQSLRQASEDLSRDFLHDMMKSCRSQLDRIFIPVILQAEQELKHRDEAGKEVFADLRTLQDIQGKLKNARALLVPAQQAVTA